MPIYTSPVSVANFQLYNNDLSADPLILGFFQSLLDTSTERIYTYLDLDFTPSALKVQTFIGDGGDFVLLHQPAGAITAWETKDSSGTVTPEDASVLILFDGGRIVVNSVGVFDATLEHRVSYTLPASLTCAETVKQAIIEVATIMLRESKQGAGTLAEAIDLYRDSQSFSRTNFSDLTSRHHNMLSPYKRYAV